MIFKMKVLRSYLSDRLSSLSEAETLSNMMKTMKESEMFDQGNATRGSEVIANMFPSSNNNE